MCSKIANSSTWPDDPEEFLEPETVFFTGNVVKYASREGRVKGLIGGRDPFLSDDEALFPAGKPSRTMGQTLLGNVGACDLGLGKMGAYSETC